MAVDDARACAGDDGCGAARADADGASSRPARTAPAGSRCAEATSRFRGSSCRGCDRRPRHPCHPSNPSSGCPTRNFRLLQHKREPGEPPFSGPLADSLASLSPLSHSSRALARAAARAFNGTGVVNCINSAREMHCALMHLVAVTRRERVSTMVARLPRFRGPAKLGVCSKRECKVYVYSSSLAVYTSRFRDIPPFRNALIFILFPKLCYLDAILKHETVEALYSLV